VTAVPTYALNPRLSPHFTAREFLANWRGGDLEARNIALGMEDRTLGNMRRLCDQILEPLRAHFGAPVTIASGFRYAELVDGRWEGLDVVIRSARAQRAYEPRSQHTRGEAADIHVQGVSERDVWEWLYRECPAPFGQVIFEVSGRSCWVHISIPGKRIESRGGGEIYGEVLDYHDGRYTRIAAVDRWRT